MTSFTVRTVNSRFITDTILVVDTASEAQAIGVRGAVAMVVDDVSGGETSAAATVMVGDGDKVLSYTAVSLSVATLCKAGFSRPDADVPPHAFEP